jgi:Protein of unknown function (DUF2997)
MPKEIQIIVNPDGTMKTDFSGFAGPSCLDAAKQLRDLLAQFGIQSACRCEIDEKISRTI